MKDAYRSSKYAQKGGDDMRKILLSLVLVLAMSTALFGNTSNASEVTTNTDDSTLFKIYGPYNFKTNDGKWDGKLSVPPGGADVTVTVRNLNYYGDPIVRLCNASTGNCTGFGPLTQPRLTRTFTNMLPGSYYGDVFTGSTSSGTITFNVR